MSDSTKKKLLHLMEENVLKGTGKNAYVKGYDIGGNTATAEKVKKAEKDEKAETYENSKIVHREVLKMRPPKGQVEAKLRLS